MESTELKELIHYNEEHERYIAIPNSLFTKLLTLTKFKKLKSQHVGFTFSYIYLQTYLFRYTKYDTYVPTKGEIKQLLGYSATNKTVDHIIKRNGLLDDESITVTSNDFPIINEWRDGDLEFTYISDLYSHEEFRNDRKFGLSQSYKVPIFGLYANTDNYFNDESNPYDGTFYPFDDGISEPYTLIDFEVFAYMMSNKELGVNAFYLYCYILYKNDLHTAGYNATHTRLAEETGLSSKSIQRYRDVMRSYNILKLEHNMDYFVHGLEDITKRKASSNYANDYKSFTYEPIEYNKQTKIGYKEYIKILDEREVQHRLNRKIEFDITQLPY